MKNKARLSTLTAFSFGKRPSIHQSSTFKRATIMIFFLRFTYQIEISKSSPEPNLMTILKVLPCQPSPEGGIILFRLLVSV